MRQTTTTRSSLAVLTAVLLAPLAAPLSWLVLPCGGLLPSAVAEQPVPGVLSAVSYPSIQAALDANPGRMIYLPSGDYLITRKIVLNKDGTGLFGPGRIIQQTADEPVIEIENASSIAVRDLTLTRAEGKMETSSEGIRATRCDDLVIENVSVIDNRTISDSRHGASQTVRLRLYLPRRQSKTRERSGYRFACRRVEPSGGIEETGDAES